MPIINRQLFADAPVLCVGDVTLAETDDLQTHREKLARILLNEMFQFVGLLDANGMTLEINQAALDGAGVRLDNVQGKPFWETHWWTVSKEAQDFARDAVRRARGGEFVRCDVENYGRAAGEGTIVVDFSVLPVKDQNGKVVFLLAEGRNITEKKQAEAELARKNEELQQLLNKIRELDEVKSDFFANVSHELRTPLALILGPVESLLADTEHLTDVQRRDLEVIRRNATTLLKHVNDLLDLAKLDAGRMAVNYARVDLARAVRVVAAHFDALASQRSISYVIEAPDALQADVDPEKFDRILVNLLSNAFKFTPVGGRIGCALELVKSDRLRLSVCDNGPGIRPAMRTVIFERFRQAEGGTTRDFGGTGLGLSIAKEFVDLHAGAITALDAPGGGALFEVELPVHAPQGAYVRCAETLPVPRDHGVSDGAEEEPQQTETNSSEAAQSPDRPLVLVAEDNPDMRRFITELLRDEYRIEPATDGADALTKAVAQPPDLVVTDLMMPKLGGDRLVAEMRSRAPLAHVPVLVLSAKADEPLRLKLLAESVQDYVTKPFAAHELRARVRNLVTMKCAQDALKNYSTMLERTVREVQASRELIGRQSDELKGLYDMVVAEQKVSERLLLNMLPSPIAERLKAHVADIGESFPEIIADSFAEVSVLFADIVDFTGFSAGMQAEQLVAMLNEIFTDFDRIADSRGLEKIKTIGDAYMAAAGLPVPAADHATRAAHMALDMIDALDRFNERTGYNLKLRIGINSGAVVAGVIGRRKFIYDLWGDAVNIASRMESQGIAGRVQITDATRRRLGEPFVLEERGRIAAKGMGELHTWFLVGRTQAS